MLGVVGDVAVAVLGAAVVAALGVGAALATLVGVAATGGVLSAAGGLWVAWHESSNANDNENAAY